MKEGGGGEGSARGSVHWGCYYATALEIEVDPHRRCFGCRESGDFALQRLVECSAKLLFITVVPLEYTLCAWGEEDRGENMCYEIRP